jgi:hypothetical protein
MTSAKCKLHSRARAFINNDPRIPNARTWLLSDDPIARQCGGCESGHDPGHCDVDRVAIQWAMAERWEVKFHQPHRPYSAEELLNELRQIVTRES